MNGSRSILVPGNTSHVLRILEEDGLASRLDGCGRIGRWGRGNFRLAWLVPVLWMSGLVVLGMPPAIAWADDSEETPSGPLLEPFDPPPLKEIEASVAWMDRQVSLPRDLAKSDFAKRPAPELTQDQALQLKNDSQQSNAKIVDALGRPPQSDDEVDWEATFWHHVSADIKSTNPVMYSAAVESEFHGLTGDGLFAFDWLMRPFANHNYVATWQSSKDGMYDKVVLRDDVTWSDGKPFTAHDVAFSFQLIMNKEVPVPAVRSGTEDLRWVAAYDDHTLIYFHKASNPTNVWNINFPVVARHVYQDSVKKDPTLRTTPYHVELEDNPVVMGPYRLVRRVRGQELIFERRESFYMHNGKQVRNKPYFRKIGFRVVDDPNTKLLALKNGLIEDCVLTAEQWRSQTDDTAFYKLNTKMNGVEWVYYYLGWNCKVPFFEDKRVRQAMSYAYDYDEMLNVLFYGLYDPASSIFHPTSWMAPETPLPRFEQDLDRAEDLLDAAGWKDSDHDGVRDKVINGRRVPFEFGIVCSQSPNSLKACILLKESLDRIGVICHVRPLEFTVLMQKTRDHEFQAMMGGWGTGTDPYTNENLFGTDKGRNYVNYSNQRVDELFEVGLAEFDRAKRADIYREIATLLHDEQPYTCLFFRRSFYGVSKSVRGMRFSPRGPFSYSPGILSLWKPKSKGQAEPVSSRVQSTSELLLSDGMPTPAIVPRTGEGHNAHPSKTRTTEVSRDAMIGPSTDWLLN